MMSNRHRSFRLLIVRFMSKIVYHPVKNIMGSIRVPGDKSISHRALIIGAVAVGETVIMGLLEGEDVLGTAKALAELGVKSSRDNGGVWHVQGVGVGGLSNPGAIIDFGNSGTGARLITGLAATHEIKMQVTGDNSLRTRPMDRVLDPLSQMGAEVIANPGKKMPFTLIGARDPNPIVSELPVPSAQVKSAILLAGLNTPGMTTVIEREPTRDHTELMLKTFGANLSIDQEPSGKTKIVLVGQPELTARAINIPGDPSSAAFAAVACLILPDSQLVIHGIGINPLRTGLFKTLIEMGACIELTNTRLETGELVADMKISSSNLKGVNVPADRAPSMIDEYPILAIAAAYARGITRLSGLSELRVKESDRLSAIEAGLKSCGVSAFLEKDDLIIEGDGNKILGGGEVKTNFDHRIAMAFLVAGVGAKNPIAIDDHSSIVTSFPDFSVLMGEIGAAINLSQ